LPIGHHPVLPAGQFGDLSVTWLLLTMHFMVKSNHVPKTRPPVLRARYRRNNAAPPANSPPHSERWGSLALMRGPERVR
jgi:hypothetical protein